MTKVYINEFIDKEANQVSDGLGEHAMEVDTRYHVFVSSFV